MSHNDEQKQLLWISIYRRKGGGEGGLRLWDMLDDPERESALRCWPMQDGELPVLVSSAGAKDRVMLTTRRLIVGANVVRLDEIRAARPKDYLQPGAKKSLASVCVVAGAGVHVEVRVPDRASCFALLHLLVHITCSES